MQGVLPLAIWHAIDHKQIDSNKIVQSVAECRIHPHKRPVRCLQPVPLERCVPSALAFFPFFVGRHGYDVKEGAGASCRGRWEETIVTFHRLVPWGSLNVIFCPAGLCSALLQESALVDPRSLWDAADPGGDEPVPLPGVLGGWKQGAQSLPCSLFQGLGAG